MKAEPSNNLTKNSKEQRTKDGLQNIKQESKDRSKAINRLKIFQEREGVKDKWNGGEESVTVTLKKGVSSKFKT